MAEESNTFKRSTTNNIIGLKLHQLQNPASNE